MTWDLIAVAVRNVGRNRRRALITIFTVFIGVLVATGVRGLLNGLQGEIKGGSIRKMNGDLQIHKNGYQDSVDANPWKLLIPASEDSLAVVLNAPGPGDEKPFITAASPRLRVMGLLNHQKTQTTTPVAVTGIDSGKELSVCSRLPEAIQAGKVLDSSREVPTGVAVDEELTEASGLDGPRRPESIAPRATGKHQIMITPQLMRGMKAEIGDEVVVLMQDKDNMQQAIVANIVAVVDYGIPGAGGRMAWIDLATLQDALGVKGQASEIALRAADGIPETGAKIALQQSVPADQVVETWADLAGFLRDAMALQDVVFASVVVIVFSIVIAAIANTSLMTVMERTREIGTLMALGYRRRHILFLFLAESTFIGMAGGIAGLFAGTVLLFVLRTRGIEMNLPGQTVHVLLRPETSIGYRAFVFVMAVVAALVSGLFPAWRASKMKPVDALSST